MSILDRNAHMETAAWMQILRLFPPKLPPNSAKTAVSFDRS